MCLVADDFAAISKRLQEIEQEAAAEAAARISHNNAEHQPESHDAEKVIAARD